MRLKNYHNRLISTINNTSFTFYVYFYKFFSKPIIVIKNIIKNKLNFAKDP